jgi:hypothetical protein
MTVVVRIQIENDKTETALVNNKRVWRGRTRHFAEDATGLDLVARHVLETPGRPQAIHLRILDLRI